MKAFANRWLDGDFVFVVWSTWFICTMLVILILMLRYRRRPIETERISSGRHRAKERLGRRRADEQYSVDYLTAILKSDTLLPYWGPTAPCPHRYWTRTLDVIVRGGDQE